MRRGDTCPDCGTQWYGHCECDQPKLMTFTARPTSFLDKLLELDTEVDNGKRESSPQQEAGREDNDRR